MVIQTQFTPTKDYLEAPSYDYSPRKREAVGMVVREDMITAIASKFYYPGSPKKSKWANVDPSGYGYINFTKAVFNSIAWTDSNERTIDRQRLGTIDERKPQITDFRLAKRFNPRRGLPERTLYDFDEVYPFYDMPTLIHGGQTESATDGTINHKRSYTGTGIGSPRRYSFAKYYYNFNLDIFSEPEEYIINTPWDGTLKFLTGTSVREKTAGAREAWDSETGTGGEIIGDCSQDIAMENFLDISAPELGRFGVLWDTEPLSIDTRTSAETHSQWWGREPGELDSLGVKYAMQHIPIELPEDTSSTTIPHYSISIDCASCIKVTHPNCAITTEKNWAGTPTAVKTFNRLEPSGITEIFSIGEPLTAIILGSKDGTGHGKYLTRFDMKYGGVGPDCFKANCIRLEKAEFRRYYPTRYSVRNGGLLNGDDGLTMGNLYYGCSALKYVPDLPDNLIDYSSFFYGCSSLIKVGEKGISGYFPNAVSMSGMVRNCGYAGVINLNAPNLNDFSGNTGATKITQITFTKSNFGSKATTGGGQTEVLNISGASMMSDSMLTVMLDSIYNYEVLQKGRRFDGLVFRMQNCLGSNSSSTSLAVAANRMRSAGATVYLTN